MAEHKDTIPTIVTPEVYGRMVVAWLQKPTVETLMEAGGISAKTARKYLHEGSPTRDMPAIRTLTADMQGPQHVEALRQSRPWLVESIRAADTLLTRYLCAIDMVEPENLPVTKLVEGLEKLLRLRAALAGVEMMETSDEAQKPVLARRYEAA